MPTPTHSKRRAVHGTTARMTKPSREGFSFISGGYPQFEGFGGYDGGKNSAFYASPLFPRPSMEDERYYDLSEMRAVDNRIYWAGSITLVTIIICTAVLAMKK